MNVTLKPTVLGGKIEAIPSKSHAHRLIICASLGDAPTRIICPSTSRDIEATAECMRALGAKIQRTGDGYDITPIDKASRPPHPHLECGESGSTLRFLLPVCAALGGEFDFAMQGRLPERPLSPLYEILCEGGVTLSEAGTNPLRMSGKLTETCFSIRANVSSQYISGLLFASPLIAERCTLALTTKPESTGYIDMTVAAMRQFGISVDIDVGKGLPVYTVSGTYTTPASEIKAEGDWSNAAFWLCAGALGSSAVTVEGLRADSLQPDRAIIDILRSFGAKIDESENTYTVYPSSLRSAKIDVSQCPDLAPVISVVAACAEGKSEIVGGARLRLKESDRIASVCSMIRALGGSAEEREDGMLISGTGLSGGVVDSARDHRIAMAAAVAVTQSSNDITILGAEATEKSYPSFFEDLGKLQLL